ncbi:ABC-2 type transporter [mine drainage metagenome]|uniref:ABC-2 type transporter n=2 Tax=mine drainage metagenome TaxID=410659 RepID=T1BI83_9ZZZZ
MPVFALARKEWKLLIRDWHALLLLFVMPAVFILVMSLAFQNKYAERQGASIHYYLVNQDKSPASVALVKDLNLLKNFKMELFQGPPSVLSEQVQRGHAQFMVRIPNRFGRAMLGRDPLPVQMVAGPTVEPAIYNLFEQTLRGVLLRVYLKQLLAPVKAMQPELDLEFLSKLHFKIAGKLLHGVSLYQVNGKNQRPSSVQQNVPAWLVFAMFFIAIPLSTTWVQERQQGTYLRLCSMGVSAKALLLGKMLPYLAINLMQVVLMLLVGVLVVPWFGGEPLMLGHTPFGLCLVSVTISFASVSYALLIANLVSTSEQATIITGVGNLLMAAVGGVMVPRFLMPPLMRSFSMFSPMSWGLEGFLDVFLRRDGLRPIALQLLWLLLFSFSCLMLAGLLFDKRRKG